MAMGIASVRRQRLVARHTRAMWARSTFGTVAMICSFYAFSSRALPLGDTSSLLNLTPLFIAVLAPLLLRERSGKRVGFAVALTMVGAVLIFRPAVLFGASAPADPHAGVTGVIATLGALASAFAMLGLRRAGAKETPEAIAAHFSIVGTIVLALLAIPFFRMPTMREGVFMLAAGVSAGSAQLAMTRAYTLENAARIAPLMFLSVVWGTALGIIGLGNRPPMTSFLGIALIIGGGLTVTILGMRDARKADNLLRS